jgi:hypothetical protein
VVPQAFDHCVAIDSAWFALQVECAATEPDVDHSLEAVGEAEHVIGVLGNLKAADQ